MHPTLKLKLVVQGGISITRGGTPVLYIGSPNSSEVPESIAQTMNFLRAGCPSVQWIVRDYFTIQEEADKFKEKIHHLIGMLQRDGEETLKILLPASERMVRKEFSVEFTWPRPVK